ncbi:hypothetical protein V6K52_12430 [Knoellia sp. S7-12]|uniref:hypothetical protein n=1 Tax=Knoellia sp. S7-12 TaxID=3126698 RepID=UPI00336678A9
MTSKHLYAVAALALSVSLPLGACSQADSTEGEAKPKASRTAYPQPAYKVNHEQAKAIAAVGQRLADGRTSEPITDEFYAIDFCHGAGEMTMAEIEPWSTGSRLPSPSANDPSGPTESDSAQLGFTIAQVVVLGSSPETMKWAEQKFEKGSACPDYDGTPLTTQKVTVPGASTSLVRTRSNPHAVGWEAHSAMGAARVENALLFCFADARTRPMALSSVTSCLTEMAYAVPLAAEQPVAITDANRDVATKMLLAQVAGKDLRATVSRRSATLPCETSRAKFLPDGTIGALIQTDEPATDEDPEALETGELMALLAAERQTDPAAARAKVAQARAKYSTCSGRYSRGAGDAQQHGAVTGVSDASFGDGGFTITRTLEFAGRTAPGIGQESIFSVGPYVIQLSSTAPERAEAIATRLKVVTGS